MSTFDEVRKCLSYRRLDSYRSQGGADADSDTLARYIWNIQLCEALYPTLQALEIALRNSLHTSIANYTQNPGWLSANSRHLHSRERDAVRRAEDKLTADGKAIEPDRLVAEMTFGFWSSLFDARYDQSTYVRPTTLWPYLLKPTFPFMPKYLRKRNVLAGRINDIRKFRNRVFHHESIWHWSNLCQQHTDIVESLDWINPKMGSLIRVVDRFPSICQTSQLSQIRILIDNI